MISHHAALEVTLALLMPLPGRVASPSPPDVLPHGVEDMAPLVSPLNKKLVVLSGDLHNLRTSFT